MQKESVRIGGRGAKGVKIEQKGEDKIKNKAVFSLSVGSILEGLGLGRYVTLFEAEDVTTASLLLMSDADFKALGLKQASRKLLLVRIAQLRQSIGGP